MTGFVDPGGNNHFPTEYPRYLRVWADAQMSGTRGLFPERADGGL